MLDALIVVAGIAFVDSLNPTTIGPALLLTMSAKPARQVLEFAAAFFLVNLAGGVLLVLGPGEWLLSLVPHLSEHAKHLLEAVGGVLLLLAAAGLWAGRRRLTRPKREKKARRSGSGFAMGGGIALAELPTALPYFAAVAAIVAAPLSHPEELVLLVVFNAIFLAPVVTIGILIGVSPGLRDSLIEPARVWLQVHWPKLAAAILAVAGVVLLVIGVAGLSSSAG